jgi:hypothetical protein
VHVPYVSSVLNLYVAFILQVFYVVRSGQVGGCADGGRSTPGGPTDRGVIGRHALERARP